MFLLTLYRIRPFSASISLRKRRKKKKPYSRGGKRERKKHHPSNPGTEQVLFATVNPSDEISANPNATMAFSPVDFSPCSIQSSNLCHTVIMRSLKQNILSSINSSLTSNVYDGSVNRVFHGEHTSSAGCGVELKLLTHIDPACVCNTLLLSQTTRQRKAAEKKEPGKISFGTVLLLLESSCFLVFFIFIRVER